MVENINIVKTIKKHSKDNIYKEIMNLVSSVEDLQLFLQKVYEIYKYPIIVTDIAFRFVGYAGPRPSPDPYWETIIETGSAAPETVINIYFDGGYTDKMLDSDGAMDASWGDNWENPQTTCTIKNGKTPIGCCSVIYKDKKNLDFVLELNTAVATAVGIYLSAKKPRNNTHVDPRQVAVARLLLENTGTTITPLLNTAIFESAKITPGFLVVVLSTTDANSARLQNVVLSLREKHNDVRYLYKGNDAYLFIWNVKTNAKTKTITDNIKYAAKDITQIYFGISQRFENLDERQAYVEQAKLAMDFSKFQNITDRAVSFTECYHDIILRMGYWNMNPLNLILPEVKTLIKYDEENKTNYCESLECYLSERGDISVSAAKLFIHRNSLMYRIKKCEEIMDVSLKEHDVFHRINLCMLIMKMMKNDANASL